VKIRRVKEKKKKEEKYQVGGLQSNERRVQSTEKS
jgi:hypothetical protein